MTQSGNLQRKINTNDKASIIIYRRSGVFGQFSEFGHKKVRTHPQHTPIDKGEGGLSKELKNHIPQMWKGAKDHTVYKLIQVTLTDKSP